MRELKDLLREAHLEARAAERCGMEGERVYPGLEAIPDDAGYLTLVITCT